MLLVLFIRYCQLSYKFPVLQVQVNPVGCILTISQSSRGSLNNVVLASYIVVSMIFILVQGVSHDSVRSNVLMSISLFTFEINRIH
jgi:hypothetical protein